MAQSLLTRLVRCSLFAQTRNTQPSLSLVSTASRSFTNRAASRPIPAQKPGLTPFSLLSSFGRGAETKVKAGSWDALWSTDGHALRAAGLPVRDRRYILWCMERFRQGESPKEFAHEPRPKKKIRGRGPAVQNGKRIRSRRRR